MGNSMICHNFAHRIAQIWAILWSLLEACRLRHEKKSKISAKGLTIPDFSNVRFCSYCRMRNASLAESNTRSVVNLKERVDRPIFFYYSLKHTHTCLCYWMLSESASTVHYSQSVASRLSQTFMQCLPLCWTRMKHNVISWRGRWCHVVSGCIPWCNCSNKTKRNDNTFLNNLSRFSISV
jgi:hypothetical protein